MKVETNEWYELHLECDGRVLMLQRNETLDDARNALALRKDIPMREGEVYKIVKVTETKEVVE